MKHQYYQGYDKLCSQTETQAVKKILALLTFYNKVEKFWPSVPLTLIWACVLAVIGYVHFLYLKAVLVFVANIGHYRDTGVYGPLVVPCEYDAWAIQPGSFSDPI